MTTTMRPFNCLLLSLALLKLLACAMPPAPQDDQTLTYRNPRLEMHMGTTPSGRQVAINLPPAPVLPPPLDPPLRTRENPDVGRTVAKAQPKAAVGRPGPVHRAPRTTGRTTVIPEPLPADRPAPPRHVYENNSAAIARSQPQVERAAPTDASNTLSFSSKSEFLDNLVKAARGRTACKITYDPAYVRIPYPGGDVAPDKGVCTDVIVRTYRRLNIDLQKEVHEDMTAAFSKYPTKWGRSEPDPNIDHRRVQNLMKFFERHGQKLPVTQDPHDYLPGDIVTWRLPVGMHIGIVVDRKVRNRERYQVVHNAGLGPEMEDFLFAYPITGHYRYYGPQSASVASETTKKVETADAR